MACRRRFQIKMNRKRGITSGECIAACRKSRSYEIQINTEVPLEFAIQKEVCNVRRSRKVISYLVNDTMRSMCVFFCIVAAVMSQEYEYEAHPQYIVNSYPEWYVNPRHRRDVTFDHKTNNGRVFGTLGQNDAGLFGKGGYEHKFFDDHRGRLDGQAYGTRVLGPYGDSSHLGGKLDWQNSNGAASLDISKQIHGPSSVTAGAGGHWPVGKNGDFSVQGTYGKTSGLPSEYGGMATYNHRW